MRRMIAQKQCRCPLRSVWGWLLLFLQLQRIRVRVYCLLHWCPVRKNIQFLLFCAQAEPEKKQVFATRAPGNKTRRQWLFPTKKYKSQWQLARAHFYR